MGNKNSCCAWRNGASRRRNLEGNNGNNTKQFYRGDQDSCSYNRDLGSAGHGERGLEREESGANLQHISEREPDDIDRDPSVHPSATTLFIERSKRAIQSRLTRPNQSKCNLCVKIFIGMHFVFADGMIRKKSMNQIHEPSPLKKSSSCSTIFLDDSTVSQPNLKNTLKCLSLAIYYHIRNRTSQRGLDIFGKFLPKFIHFDTKWP
jgi:hypothetical protein